ncbi:MAG: glutamine synthetase, partial [Acetatifactor sp.]|nr:glutamine synthetase [Acetatifactor sp.]
NISVNTGDASAPLDQVIAGILAKIQDMTVFLNPTENSYERFGCNKAPKYISWSAENRSQLIRIPALVGGNRRAELRSPDPAANPYLAFALIIHAGLDGIMSGRELPEAVDYNLYSADPSILSRLSQLPKDLESARQAACNSLFIQNCIPGAIRDIYYGK